MLTAPVWDGRSLLGFAFATAVIAMAFLFLIKSVCFSLFHSWELVCFAFLN
jgi:hypothetical protein